MDISNLTTNLPLAPTVEKANGATGSSKPVTRGNSLPESRQVRLRSEGPQVENSASQLKPEERSKQPEEPLSTEELHRIVDQANDALSIRSTNLKFMVAEGTDINVVRIEDSETGELIRQIPSEQIVALAEALEEFKQGTKLEEQGTMLEDKA
jgi:flagellar protein FlaG